MKQERYENSFGEGANTVEDGDDFSEVLTVSGKGSHGSEWILDSRASCQVCPNWSSFTTYRDYGGESVFVGDDYAYKVVGIDTVHIRMFNGIELVLEDMKHVPKMKMNVISLSALEAKGCMFIDRDRCCEVMKGTLVYMKARGCGHLYMLIGSTIHGGAVRTAVRSMVARMWQVPKGHMGKAENGVNLQG